MSQNHRALWSRKDQEFWKVRIGATLPRACVDCGKPVTPDQKWQVGHITPLAVAREMGWSRSQINTASNLGPSHLGCNQRAGGTLGARKTNARRHTVEGSRWDW